MTNKAILLVILTIFVQSVFCVATQTQLDSMIVNHYYGSEVKISKAEILKLRDDYVDKVNSLYGDKISLLTANDLFRYKININKIKELENLLGYSLPQIIGELSTEDRQKIGFMQSQFFREIDVICIGVVDSMIPTKGYYRVAYKIRVEHLLKTNSALNEYLYFLATSGPTYDKDGKFNGHIQNGDEPIYNVGDRLLFKGNKQFLLENRDDMYSTLKIKSLEQYAKNCIKSFDELIPNPLMWAGTSVSRIEKNRYYIKKTPFDKLDKYLDLDLVIKGLLDFESINDDASFFDREYK